MLSSHNWLRLISPDFNLRNLFTLNWEASDVGICVPRNGWALITEACRDSPPELGMHLPWIPQLRSVSHKAYSLATFNWKAMPVVFPQAGYGLGAFSLVQQLNNYNFPLRLSTR